MSEKRPPYPFKQEDAEARQNTIEQFHEDKRRVPEVLYGESALKKYETEESPALEESSSSDGERTEEMKAALRKKLLEEIENSPAKQIKVVESNLTREEYVEKLINPS